MKTPISRFLTFLFVLILPALGLAEKKADGVRTSPADNAINLIYTPDTGNLALDNRVDDPSNPGTIRDLTSLQILSPGHLLVVGSAPEFSGDKPASFVGIFDVYNVSPSPGEPQKAFKLVPDGFAGNISTFANAGVGRMGSEMAADFIFDGSFKGGGDLDSTSIFIVVPEPSAVALAVIGLTVFALRRKR